MFPCLKRVHLHLLWLAAEALLKQFCHFHIQTPQGCSSSTSKAASAAAGHQSYRRVLAGGPGCDMLSTVMQHGDGPGTTRQDGLMMHGPHTKGTSSHTSRRRAHDAWPTCTRDKQLAPLWQCLPLHCLNYYKLIRCISTCISYSYNQLNISYTYYTVVAPSQPCSQYRYSLQGKQESFELS